MASSTDVCSKTLGETRGKHGGNHEKHAGRIDGTMKKYGVSSRGGKLMKTHENSMGACPLPKAGCASSIVFVGDDHHPWKHFGKSAVG